VIKFNEKATITFPAILEELVELGKNSPNKMGTSMGKNIYKCAFLDGTNRP
jgi:hypothetical protein